MSPRPPPPRPSNASRDPQRSLRQHTATFQLFPSPNLTPLWCDGGTAGRAQQRSDGITEQRRAGGARALVQHAVTRWAGGSWPAGLSGDTKRLLSARRPSSQSGERREAQPSPLRKQQRRRGSAGRLRGAAAFLGMARGKCGIQWAVCKGCSTQGRCGGHRRRAAFRNAAAPHRPRSGRVGNLDVGFVSPAHLRMEHSFLFTGPLPVAGSQLGAGALVSWGHLAFIRTCCY